MALPAAIRARRENTEPEAESSTSVEHLCAALAFVFVLGLPSLFYPFHPDHGMFATVGDWWLRGAVPYRDAWDVKPPGIFALYAASELVFGKHMAAARLADLAFTLAAAGFLYVLARRACSARMAMLAPVLFGLVYFTSFEFQDSAQAESFAAAFIAGFVWALVKSSETGNKRYLIGAGVVLGFAMLLKTTFILYAILIPVAAPTRGFRDLPRQVGHVALGAIAPVALMLVYFAANGALGYLFELFAAQRAYASIPDSDAMGRSLRSAVRFFRERPAVTMLCVFALLGIVIAARKRYGFSGLHWAWAGIAALTIAIQWRCHSYHFLVLLPPLALLAGRAVSGMWESSFYGLPRHLAFATTLVIVLGPVAMGMGRFGLMVKRVTGAISDKQYWACFAAPGWYPFGGSAQTAEYVRRISRKSDKLLVFDYDPAIYFLSDRVSPTRHLSNEPIIGSYFFPEEMRNRWKQEQVEDVERNPPELLVVGTCPHCHGLSREHIFAPKTVTFGRAKYALLKTIVKDRIYRRLKEARYSASRETTEPISSLMRTTARGE